MNNWLVPDAVTLDIVTFELKALDPLPSAMGIKITYESPALINCPGCVSPLLTGIVAVTAALVLKRKNTSVVPALVMNHAPAGCVFDVTLTLAATFETLANTVAAIGLNAIPDMIISFLR